LITSTICQMPGDTRALRRSLAPVLGAGQGGTAVLLDTAHVCPTNAQLAALTVPLFAAELDANRSAAPAAIGALRWLGPLAARGTPALVRRLERRQPADDSYITGALLEALAAIGPAAAPALPNLLDLVAPASVELRGKAAAAIAAIGPGTTVGFAELRTLLAESLVAPDCRFPFRAAANTAKAIHALPAGSWQPDSVLEVLHRSDGTPPQCLEYREREALTVMAVLGAELAGDSNEALSAQAILHSADKPLFNRSLAGEVLVAMGRVQEADQPFLDALARKKALHSMPNGEPFVDVKDEFGSQLGLRALSNALQICRAEANQPPFESAAALLKQLARDVGQYDQGHSDAAACLEGHLCGPDSARMQATLATCCAKAFTQRRPAWCPSLVK
jgi:hypothetical protein